MRFLRGAGGRFGRTFARPSTKAARRSGGGISRRCSQGRWELLQVFQNLIGNAIKYRAGGPPAIEVSCEDAAPGGVSRCATTALASIRPKPLWFSNRSGGCAGLAQGAGAGLAICKRIVERRGGKIWVEPAAFGLSRQAGRLPDTAGEPRAARLDKPEAYPTSAAGGGATFYFTVPKNGVSQ